MERSSMIGSRIRERRVMNGIKQSDLAQSVGISASYLNLIEHNRRRIGGKTLNRLAEVLDVPLAQLSEGAEAALLHGLRAAAERNFDTAPTSAELDRIEEFAGRFPGWAQLLTDVARQRDELQASVKELTDRIAHDPELAASLHEVISTVTAIHSTASILADTRSLEPQWQNRFHRNLNEDSQRLAQEAEALVRYLEGEPGADTVIQSPLDQMHSFMEASGFHFPELEGAGGSARIEALLDRSDVLQSDAARRIAGKILEQYVSDARALPIDDISSLVGPAGPDPQDIANESGQDLACVFRRLAMLPKDLVGSVGLFICDGAGRLIIRKSVLGFEMPRSTSACVHWPLYQVLACPGIAIRQRLRQKEARVLAMAVCDVVAAQQVDRPALYHGHMLILPDPGQEAAGASHEVGTNCLLCTLGECDRSSGEQAR